MGTVDRRPYLTATSLDQALLDQMADNLDYGIEMVADVEIPSGAQPYSNLSANLVTVSQADHPFWVGASIVILTASDAGLVGTFTVTAINGNSFTFNKGSAVTPTSGHITYRQYLRVSDRNKYVGERFYKALCKFPLIKRTLGEWLSPEIEFSTLQLVVSNVRGDLNKYLPGGERYSGWIGKPLNVRLGIRDSAATYLDIYQGKVTEIGGLTRDRSTVTIRTRDRLDSLNRNFPTQAVTQATWPDLEDSLAGTLLAVVYGDWGASPLQVGKDASGMDLGETASVPTVVVNGKNAGVLAGSANVRILISENDNTSFDTSNVWVKRGEIFGLVPSGNITSVAANRDFEVIQAFTFDVAPYVYQSGDAFFVRVMGKSIAGSNTNFVDQAKDLLVSYGGADAGSDFSSAWSYYNAKTSPAESASGTFHSRICQTEQESVVTYALSLLEQVRLELFQDKNLQLSLAALHLDEFEASPSFTVKQWDLKADTLTPLLDDRNIWNRVRASYAYDPAAKSETRQTPIYRVQGSIDQIGRAISKKVIFPNMYVESEVVYNVKEMLKLATGGPEFIEATLTQRATLLDLGDFVALNVSMGSLVFENVPAMIRELGHDPAGYGVPVKLWSFQTTPFTGWTPSYSGIVGGSTATITEES